MKEKRIIFGVSNKTVAGMGLSELSVQSDAAGVSSVC
jgi:hypothetical protein